ncbi:MAG TPA: hypothetical protein PKH77_26585, partial [Anaerolineae bacterium]|nr:hypothetical protein [Anaerolineae bacterium]
MMAKRRGVLGWRLGLSLMWLTACAAPMAAPPLTPTAGVRGPVVSVATFTPEGGEPLPQSP